MPENKQKFCQYSETDPLKRVIIGRCKGYRKVEAYVQHVNDKQESGLPATGTLKEEFADFAAALRDCGVEVLHPDYVGKFVYDQLTPRDIGITIGDKFVLCNMAKSSRRYEAAGLFRHILSLGGDEPNILIPPEPAMLLEGGDIIIDKPFIFAGLTGRTNKAGVRYLQQMFEPEFKVVPIVCRTSGGDEVLHLDCVFNPIGEQHALVYPQGLKSIPDEITETYKLIEVDRAAQRALATNVLSLDEKTVISRAHPACDEINEAMQKADLKVITLSFDGAPSTGGSFRCCSLPLIRTA